MTDDETLASKSTPATRPESGEGPRWPARLGHYVMLQELGRGGMGVVFAAYDQVLDRKVAIKLLRGRGDAQAHTRLVREAQALARLSHPNVVQIYEIGEFEQLAFIVMEFVDGVTLRTWLSLEARSLEAILAVFDAAGRGLAAAHVEGLVHRDFKPDNVMIRRDGRVLVMDFGLARGEAGETGTPISELLDSQSTELGSTSKSSGNQLAADLTRTGTLLGTPAYMAPEQFRGLGTDAKTDQFAFCVAAWEALTGVRPFAGNNVAALSLSVTSGTIEAPPSGLPSWIRKHLERGLATDPAERWPSLDALLAALGDDPTRRRWVLIATVGLLAIGVAVAFGLGVARERERAAAEAACEAEGQAITEDWTADDRAAIEQAFLATELPAVGDSWPRVQAAMDAYAQTWTALRTSACLESRDEPHYAAMVECLDEHRTTFATLVDTWHTPTLPQVSDAAVAAGHLPPLAICSNPVVLAARARLPDDPELRERVTTLRHRLDQVRALQLALDYEAGQREAEAILLEAEAIGWLPLVAEARLRLAQLLRKLGRIDEAHAAMQQAFAEAGEAGHDLVTLEAANALSDVVGRGLGRLDGGLVWSEVNLMLIRRLGLDGSLYESDYLDRLGGLHTDRGEYQAALESHSRALELREASLGPETLEVAQSLAHLGTVHLYLGRMPEARAFLERALATREQLLGPNHTLVASTLDNLGIVVHSLGEHEQALEIFERSYAIWSSVLAPGHIDLVVPLGNLGASKLEQGDFAGALESFTSVLAIQEGALGRDHPDLVTTLANMGQTQRNLGELENAIASYSRATDLLERHLGPKHPRLVFMGQKYAAALALAGRHEEARVQLERSLAIGLTDEATTPDDLADIRFALARSLWALGERDPAREQATAAQELLPADDPHRAMIVAWLAKPE
jgi:tetratricopeptide (TPR) repeat protein/predicted Ser/Thr protein kinase